MRDVNETTPPPVVLEPVKRKPMGKRNLPVERKRVMMPVRVLPSTLEYIEKMGYPSCGRAIDVLVKTIQHKGALKMLAEGKQVSIVNLMS